MGSRIAHLYRVWNRRLFSVGLLCAAISLSGCATYYQQNIAFHRSVESGDYPSAVRHLEADGMIHRQRNRLLYHLEKGAVLHMAEDHAASNESFENAYQHIETTLKNYGLEAVGFITNPTVVPYPGEDFERVQIHYFKALNFAAMGNISDALVECRRINIKLAELNDRYKAGEKNRYSGDAFAWNVMGMFFDAAGENNNAFICYRNALNTYEENYVPHYDLYPPHRLISDLLNAAYRAGMTDEYAFYKNQYQPDWRPAERNPENGEIIVFWNNGLGPVKSEESVNFFINRGSGGVVTFVSEDSGFWLPVPATGHDTGSFADMRFIRLTVPVYTERTPYFESCVISCNNVDYPLEKAQDINAIAISNLQDRMGRELGRALLRMAIKYGIEQAVRHQDEAAGVIVSIINALTEKADTRNWQTLPHDIHYTRFSAPAGTHSLKINRLTVGGESYETTRDVLVESGRISFVTLFDPASVSLPF